MYMYWHKFNLFITLCLTISLPLGILLILFSKRRHFLQLTIHEQELRDLDSLYDDLANSLWHERLRQKWF